MRRNDRRAAVAAFAALAATSGCWASEEIIVLDDSCGTAAIAAQTACAGEIRFADPALEAAVREELDRPTGELSAADLAQILVLDAGSRDIEKLDGIECLASATHVDLSNNRIADLAPLAALDTLLVLELRNNRIESIEPIACLEQLESLHLAENAIADLSPVAGLAALQRLDVRANRIDDVRSVAGLSALEDLMIESNQVRDLAPFIGLAKLRDTNFSDNQITDLTPLVANASLADGARVGVGDNPIDESDQADNIAALCDRGAFVAPYCPFTGD
jgi:internalin A